MLARTIPTCILIATGAAAAQTATTVQQNPGSTTTVQTQPGSTTTTVQPPPQPPPPSSQVVVNPPPETAPPQTATSSALVVEREAEPPSPLAIVATDALYGGLAGVLVGGGVALVNQGANWGRDLMVGAAWACSRERPPGASMRCWSRARGGPRGERRPTGRRATVWGSGRRRSA